VFGPRRCVRSELEPPRCSLRVCTLTSLHRPQRLSGGAPLPEVAETDAITAKHCELKGSPLAASARGNQRDGHVSAYRVVGLWPLPPVHSQWTCH
jgi:hypothetical protein